MTPPSPDPIRIRFDNFEADLRTEELWRTGRKLKLPLQSFRVLAMMLERPGQLVTRDELRARLWPTSTQIEHDQGLNAAVNRLREALRDSAEAPRFVETLPRRGYRFIGKIVTDESLPSPSHPGPSDSERTAAAIAPLVNDTNRVRTPNELSATHAAENEKSASGKRADGKRLFATAVGLIAAVLVIVAAISWMNRPHATRAALGRQVVPFTTLPGQAIAPSFSPDGSQIAFAWNGDAGAAPAFDLYVKSLGSERLLRLTQQPSRWITPAWSPDGSTIAFVRRTEKGTGLFVVPAISGSERSIVPDGVSISSYVQVSWSPDGRRLAYSAYGPAGTAQVYIVALDSLSTEALAPAPANCLDAGVPAFSPDGRRLALVCVSSSAVYSIYTVDLPHGPLRELATLMGYSQGLAWAPDGKRLIVSNDAGDGGKLWQLTLAGELEELPFGENGSSPAIALRGERMAYVRGSRTIDLWRADLTAPRPEESATKLIYSTRSQVLGRYSPDGSRIAFQSNRSGSTEIWLTTAQGNDPERLTSFGGPFTSAPAWCSDGQRIAFDSRISGESAIYIEDLRERVPRKVATSHNNLSLPAWSEDCRWLFASDGVGGLYRFASSGGPAERFSKQPAYYPVVVGDRVIFNVMTASGVDLWSKPVKGGAEEPLENMPRVGYSHSWAATTSGVYYTDSSHGPVTLKLYDFASRTIRPVMMLKENATPGGGPGIGVSPDGRWLLYSQTDDARSEIMLAPAP